MNWRAMLNAIHFVLFANHIFSKLDNMAEPDPNDKVNKLDLDFNLL